MLGIDDNNNLTTRNSRAIDAATINHMAPPVYGHHQLDQLYSDVDFSGFQTPAGLASEVGTPFGAQSRAASVDNLTSINETASSEVAANTLRNRLDNLNTTEDSRAIRAQAAATAPPNDTDSLLRLMLPDKAQVIASPSKGLTKTIRYLQEHRRPCSHRCRILSIVQVIWHEYLAMRPPCRHAQMYPSTIPYLITRLPLVHRTHHHRIKRI